MRKTAILSLLLFIYPASAETPQVFSISLKHRYPSEPLFSKNLDRGFFLTLIDNAPCEPADLAAAVRDDRSRASCGTNDNCQIHWTDAVVNACFFPMVEHTICNDINRTIHRADYEYCVLNAISREDYYPWQPDNNHQDAKMAFPDSDDFQDFVDETVSILDGSYPDLENIRDMQNLGLPDRDRLKQALMNDFDPLTAFTICSGPLRIVPTRISTDKYLCRYQNAKLKLEFYIRRAAAIYAVID